MGKGGDDCGDCGDCADCGSGACDVCFWGCGSGGTSTGDFKCWMCFFATLFTIIGIVCLVVGIKELRSDIEETRCRCDFAKVTKVICPAAPGDGLNCYFCQSNITTTQNLQGPLQGYLIDTDPKEGAVPGGCTSCGGEFTCWRNKKYNEVYRTEDDANQAAIIYIVCGAISLSLGLYLYLVLCLIECLDDRWSTGRPLRQWETSTQSEGFENGVAAPAPTPEVMQDYNSPGYNYPSTPVGVPAPAPMPTPEKVQPLGYYPPAAPQADGDGGYYG